MEVRIDCIDTQCWCVEWLHRYPIGVRVVWSGLVRMGGEGWCVECGRIGTQWG